MVNPQERLHRASLLLAPYAVPLEGALGRTADEPHDERRFPFQRDRDRIIHTQAFRRLQGKAQVFVAGEGDHYRTRLTHTMEVTQIARDLARSLSLNEDLAECVALAHDLGHPPFGHAGEDALDAWMRVHGSSFEHNEQSLRTVTVLEEHSPLSAGLNLNREVLEGLQKHRETPSPDRPSRGLSLEAQAVDCADEIAYTGHDCDDGLRAGLFGIEDVMKTRLAAAASEQAKARGTSLRGGIIHLLVNDLYRTSEKTLQEKNIRTLDDVYARHARLIGFSPEMQEGLKELRNFLWEHMYLHAAVRQRSLDGQEIVTRLCERYFARPTEKIIQLRERTKSTLPEAVKDYVAGMTDQYARQQEEGL